MKIGLWIVQILLAALFLWSGITKLLTPHAELAQSMRWVADATDWQVLLIGAVEVLGALGLVLPAATGILPWLTPLAAIGLALEMVPAAIVNLQYGQATVIGVNIVIILLALFVAVGRVTRDPARRLVRAAS